MKKTIPLVVMTVATMFVGNVNGSSSFSSNLEDKIMETPSHTQQSTSAQTASVPSSSDHSEEQKAFENSYADYVTSTLRYIAMYGRTNILIVGALPSDSRWMDSDPEKIMNLYKLWSKICPESEIGKKETKISSEIPNEAHETPTTEESDPFNSETIEKDISHAPAFWQVVAQKYQLTFVSDENFDNYKELGFDYIGTFSGLCAERSKDESERLGETAAALDGAMAALDGAMAALDGTAAALDDAMAALDDAMAALDDAEADDGAIYQTDDWHTPIGDPIEIYQSKPSAHYFPVTVCRADFNSKIFGEFVHEVEVKFPLIINDYCVSYFLTKYGLHNILQLQDPTGISVFGPIVADQRTSFCLVDHCPGQLRTDRFFGGYRICDGPSDVYKIYMTLSTTKEEVEEQYAAFSESLNRQELRDKLEQNVHPQLKEFTKEVSFAKLFEFVAEHNRLPIVCPFGNIALPVNALLPYLNLHLKDSLDLYGGGKELTDLNWVIIGPHCFEKIKK